MAKINEMIATRCIKCGYQRFCIKELGSSACNKCGGLLEIILYEEKKK